MHVHVTLVLSFTYLSCSDRGCSCSFLSLPCSPLTLIISKVNIPSCYTGFRRSQQTTFEKLTGNIVPLLSVFLCLAISLSPPCFPLSQSWTSCPVTPCVGALLRLWHLRNEKVVSAPHGEQEFLSCCLNSVRCSVHCAVNNYSDSHIWARALH